MRWQQWGDVVGYGSMEVSIADRHDVGSAEVHDLHG